MFLLPSPSANCKAPDVFSFLDHTEKYGKLNRPAFVRAMKEAQEALDENSGSQSDTVSKAYTNNIFPRSNAHYISSGPI